MIRVVGVLCWYDEERASLVRAVSSAAAAGVTGLVAVDGAYASFSTERPYSPADQHLAIRDAAAVAEIPVVFGFRTEPWPSEMEKRTHSFELAQELAPDWLLLLDADFEVRAERLLGETLAGVEEDAAEVRLLTPPGPSGSARYGPMPDARERLLIRAVPGLRVERNHYTYVTPSGARLRGNPAQAPLAPAADLSDVVTILHWTYHRPQERLAAQFGYYEERDRSMVEVGPCVRCAERQASYVVPADLRDLGPAGVEWGWAEVCSACEPAARREAIKAGVRLGVPATDVADHVRTLVPAG